jgi:DNA-binding beta-propeller fold protein YncE
MTSDVSSRYGRHSWISGCAALAVALAASSAFGADDTPAPFRVSATSQVGGEGGWDYAAYQASNERLYVARVGGVLVLDTRTMKPVGTIPSNAGTRVHGVALAADLGLGFTSDGHDETATVFDSTTLQVVRRINLGHLPDAIIYDPASRKGITFDGDENVAIAFDPIAGKVVAEVKLPGSPEGAVADGRGHVYVNLSDKDEIASLNTHSWTVEQHWPIGGGCSNPTPLAMDTSSDRLFVACRSGVLAVVDASRHVVIATLPSCKGVDGAAVDPKSGLIFVSCNEGTLGVAKAVSSDRYEFIQSVSTAKGARTLALDTKQLRVFLPVAEFGPMLPQTGDAPSRPAIVPETFRILTVSR